MLITRAVASLIIGGGADIHIYWFTHHKISKEINCAEHEYMNISPPPPIIELATALLITLRDHPFEGGVYTFNILKCKIILFPRPPGTIIFLKSWISSCSMLVRSNYILPGI